MTRKLISIFLILLIFSSAALADVPVLDLRAHDADARFPSDAAVLTVAFPQMTFADAAILVCDGHAGMIDAGGYAEESADAAGLGRRHPSAPRPSARLRGHRPPDADWALHHVVPRERKRADAAYPRGNGGMRRAD